MTESLFPGGTFFAYSWAPFLASSILSPAMDLLVSIAIMWWKPLAWVLLSATSVTLKTASKRESYEYLWLSSVLAERVIFGSSPSGPGSGLGFLLMCRGTGLRRRRLRSEEHTSELQSRL